MWAKQLDLGHFILKLDESSQHPNATTGKQSLSAAKVWLLKDVSSDTNEERGTSCCTSQCCASSDVT